MNKPRFTKTVALLIATSTVGFASPFSSNTPYTNVVPLGNGPAYPNRTNLNVNYWSTGAGWADVSMYPDPSNNIAGLSIVDDISNGGAAPNGQQWSTTDPANVGVLQVNGFTDADGNPQDPAIGGQSFNFGGDVTQAAYGLYPSITNPSYYNTFNTQYNDANAVWTFAEFVISGPSASLDPALPDQDAFGFSLWNGAPGVGSALAEFKFGRQYMTPAGLANTNLNNFVGFAWFLNGVQQDVNNNAALTGDWTIQYNSLNRLNVSIQTNNTLWVSLDSLSSAPTNFGALVINTSFITNGALSGGLNWSDYNTVSIDWALANNDPFSPGANFMTVNTIEVVATTVPEPGTWAVGALLLGGVAASVYRRRQAAAAKA